MILNFEFNKFLGNANNISSKFRYMVALQKRTKVVTRLSSSSATWNAEAYSFSKGHAGVLPPKVEKDQPGKLSIPTLGGLQHEEYFLETFKRSNQDTCLTHKPNVTEGSWVQSGDLLTDCASSVGGDLSLGQNLLIAYMPWEGYNFEDAILISERLVIDDLYTSIHIERYELEIQKTKLGAEEITRNIPDVSEQEIAHLDSFGVVKLGSWIEEGDILIGKITPINKKKISPYQKLLYSILEKQVRPIKDSSLRAPKGIKAKVIDIKYFFKPVTKTKPSANGARSSLSPSTKAKANSINNQERQLKAEGKNKQQKQIKKERVTTSASPQPLGERRGKAIEGLLLTQKRSLRKLGKSHRGSITSKSLFWKNRGQTSFAHGVRKANPVSFAHGVRKANPVSFALEPSKARFPSFANSVRGKKSFLKKINLLFSKINYSSFNLRFLLFCCRFWSSMAGRSLTPASQGLGNGHRGPLVDKKPAQALLKEFALAFVFDEREDRTPLALRGSPAQMSFSKLANAMQRDFRLLSQKQYQQKKMASYPRSVKTFANANSFSLGNLKTGKNGSVKATSIKNKNIETIHIYLAEKRKIQVGDKMAGRHGNKGIVSQILPIQDMPFLPDGTPIDMVLNPLGVPSRMNVGQIYECLLGLAGKFLGENYKISSFDEIYGPEASRSFVFNKLYEASTKTGFKWLFDPNSPGKTRLFDGRNGELFDQKVTVGLAYMLRLVHMVDDKIHARSTGPYSLVTQQPLRGRSKQGGQRLGEMEVWAIEGYGAAFTLLEMLTIKSDDMTGRMTLWSNLILNKDISIGTPESFKVLICELQALCLDIGLYRSESRYTETYNKKGNLKLREIQNLMNLP